MNKSGSPSYMNKIASIVTKRKRNQYMDHPVNLASLTAQNRKTLVSEGRTQSEFTMFTMI